MKSDLSRFKNVSLFFLAGVFITACAKKDDPPPPVPTPATTLCGTAAQGAALAGRTVEIKDQNGVFLTGTTGPDGKFSIALQSGLTPPLMVRVETGVGQYLYSIASVANTTTANVHPYSNLIVQSYYQAEGLDPDLTFENLSSTSPTPSSFETEIIQTIVNRFLELWVASEGLDPNTFDFLTTPFDADGTQFDLILDQTTIMPVGSDTQITITNVGATVTQTTMVSVNGSTKEMTASTQVTEGGITSTHFDSGIIVQPSPSAMQSALAGCNTTLEQYRTAANAQGAALSYTNLLPYYSANYLHGGEDENFSAGMGAEDMRGITTDSFSIHRVTHFDEIHQVLSAVARHVAGPVENHWELAMKDEAGTWILYGDQENIGTYMTCISRRAYSGGGPPVDSKWLEFWIWCFGTNIINSATVSGGPLTNEPLNLIFSQNELVQADPLPAAPMQFTKNERGLQHQLAGNYPAVGTPFTLSIDTTSGVVTRIRNLSQWTDWLTTLSGPTGHTLTDANLGSVLTINWTLPSTNPPQFSINEICAIATMGNGTGTAEIDCNETLSITSTTATFNLPTQLNSQPLSWVLIHVNIDGRHGEDSRATWRFQ
jgi:hypothetical protein